MSCVARAHAQGMARRWANLGSNEAMIHVPNFVMDRDVLEVELDDGLGLVCILTRV